MNQSILHSRKFRITVIGIAVFLTMSFVGQALIRNDETKRLKDVYEVCQAQRTGHWQIPMMTCGQIEKMNQAEYLCDGNNASPSLSCWTEAK